MNSQNIVMFALLTTSLTTQVLEPANSQWKMVALSLNDLIQSGYMIVAVTNNQSSNGPSVETFFLQKNTSVFKCWELHTTDAKAKKSSTHLSCFQLVKPYSVEDLKPARS